MILVASIDKFVNSRSGNFKSQSIMGFVIIFGEIRPPSWFWSSGMQPAGRPRFVLSDFYILAVSVVFKAASCPVVLDLIN